MHSPGDDVELRGDRLDLRGGGPQAPALALAGVGDVGGEHQGDAVDGLGGLAQQRDVERAHRRRSTVHPADGTGILAAMARRDAVDSPAGTDVPGTLEVRASPLPGGVQLAGLGATAAGVFLNFGAGWALTVAGAAAVVVGIALELGQRPSPEVPDDAG